MLDTILSPANPAEVFEIRKGIAQGAFANVYKGKLLATGEQVALKIINLQECEDFDEEQIANEITLLQRCRHENLPQLFGSYRDEENIYLVLELLEGGSMVDIYTMLKDIREDYCNIPLSLAPTNFETFPCWYFPEEYLKLILRDVLKAMLYLHSNKIIHRDIKGGNIVLSRSGQAKLIDFGSAASVDSGDLQEFTGTPYWMAPEVAENRNFNSKYNLPADVWSIGVTALEIAEGKPPHADVNPMRALLLIPTSLPPTVSQPQYWSTNFVDWLKNCLAMEPTERAPVEELLRHPFITTAKEESLLAEITCESLKKKARGSCTVHRGRKSLQPPPPPLVPLPPRANTSRDVTLQHGNDKPDTPPPLPERKRDKILPPKTNSAVHLERKEIHPPPPDPQSDELDDGDDDEEPTLRHVDHEELLFVSGSSSDDEEDADGDEEGNYSSFLRECRESVDDPSLNSLQSKESPRKQSVVVLPTANKKEKPPIVPRLILNMSSQVDRIEEKRVSTEVGNQKSKGHATRTHSTEPELPLTKRMKVMQGYDEYNSSILNRALIKEQLKEIRKLQEHHVRAQEAVLKQALNDLDKKKHVLEKSRKQHKQDTEEQEEKLTRANRIKKEGVDKAHKEDKKQLAKKYQEEEKFLEKTLKEYEKSMQYALKEAQKTLLVNHKKRLKELKKEQKGDKLKDPSQKTKKTELESQYAYDHQKIELEFWHNISLEKLTKSQHLAFSKIEEELQLEGAHNEQDCELVFTVVKEDELFQESLLEKNHELDQKWLKTIVVEWENERLKCKHKLEKTQQEEQLQLEIIHERKALQMDLKIEEMNHRIQLKEIRKEHKKTLKKLKKLKADDSLLARKEHDFATRISQEEEKFKEYLGAMQKEREDQTEKYQLLQRKRLDQRQAKEKKEQDEYHNRQVNELKEKLDTELVKVANLMALRKKELFDAKDAKAEMLRANYEIKKKIMHLQQQELRQKLSLENFRMLTELELTFSNTTPGDREAKITLLLTENEAQMELLRQTHQQEIDRMELEERKNKLQLEKTIQPLEVALEKLSLPIGARTDFFTSSLAAFPPVQPSAASLTLSSGDNPTTPRQRSISKRDVGYFTGPISPRKGSGQPANSPRKESSQNQFSPRKDSDIDHKFNFKRRPSKDESR